MTASKRRKEFFDPSAKVSLVRVRYSKMYGLHLLFPPGYTIGAPPGDPKQVHDRIVTIDMERVGSTRIIKGDHTYHRNTSGLNRLLPNKTTHLDAYVAQELYTFWQDEIPKAWKKYQKVYFLGSILEDEEYDHFVVYFSWRRNKGWVYGLNPIGDISAGSNRAFATIASPPIHPEVAKML